MLLNADAKQLEWICAAFLSQDPVAIEEILQGTDQHTDNMQRFGLPSRLIAKTFVFRLIYGGSAYSYANDHNFSSIGNEDFWQFVINQFYEKYKGLKVWHDSLLTTVKQEGKIVMPTGRFYKFEPEIKRNYMGEYAVYPRTKILNYPVQGLGADLMTIARVSLKRRLKGKLGVLLINTVHDSIMLDFDSSIWDNNSIVNLVTSSFNDVPKNFERLFETPFNLPMRVQCELGTNWGNMEEISADYSN